MRDYLVRPAAVMREEARAALKLKRLLWKGRTLEEATLEVALPDTWTLVQIGKLTASADSSTRGERFPPTFSAAEPSVHANSHGRT